MGSVAKIEIDCDQEHGRRGEQNPLLWYISFNSQKKAEVSISKVLTNEKDQDENQTIDHSTDLV